MTPAATPANVSPDRSEARVILVDAAAGATYVPTLSTLSDHELCSAGSRVVPIASAGRGSNVIDQQQGHPRLPWQMMIADQVRAKLR